MTSPLAKLVLSGVYYLLAITLLLREYPQDFAASPIDKIAVILVVLGNEVVGALAWFPAVYFRYRRLVRRCREHCSKMDERSTELVLVEPDLALAQEVLAHAAYLPGRRCVENARRAQQLLTALSSASRYSDIEALREDLRHVCHNRKAAL